MRKNLKIRAVLAWMLIAAIFIRGLIPMGYMPDFSKPASLFPALRICGGHAPKPADDPQAKTDIPCSFTINAAFSFAGAEAPALPAAPVLFLALLVAPAALLLKPQRRFGNASSRSPPYFI